MMRYVIVINPAALLQSEYIFIIHIFKFYLRIVKKILHLNLEFSRYNILISFNAITMLVITRFKTN